MDLPQYLQGLSFRFVEPGQKRSLSSHVAAALTRLGVPLDGLNTRLPFDRSDMRRKLRRTRVGTGGSTLALRAVLNRSVAHLEEHEAFVAFGLGDGDALLAAIAGNRDKLCIGVQEGVPSHSGDPFLRRFEELSNDDCHFIEQSFEACVARLADRSVGMCFVSADSHEPIAERLVDCEPHLAENAYLLIDNANCEGTRRAAFEFVATSRNQYRVLIEAHTAETCALTWGRGVLVMQLLGRNAAALSRPAISSMLVPAA